MEYLPDLSVTAEARAGSQAWLVTSTQMPEIGLPELLRTVPAIPLEAAIADAEDRTNQAVADAAAKKASRLGLCKMVPPLMRRAVVDLYRFAFVGQIPASRGDPLGVGN
ncbi:MAG TPA: hypothetical protein VNA87_06250 [Actinomycetota bacterium]|nr:hypothetical protein [Actinomycetota bacterium]